MQVPPTLRQDYGSLADVKKRVNTMPEKLLALVMMQILEALDGATDRLGGANESAPWVLSILEPPPPYHLLICSMELSRTGVALECLWMLHSHLGLIESISCS